MDLQYKILHTLEVDMYHSTAWGLCKIWRTVYVSKSTLNVLQLRFKFIYVNTNFQHQLLIGGPSGRLDFVLRTLWALGPCDPHKDVVSVRMVSVRVRWGKNVTNQ